jgi:hypothetical protein
VRLDRGAREQREATPLDDDGFESLNGNGSSENGEEVAEDAEEVGQMQSEISEELATQNRSSLNWKSSVQDIANFSVTGKSQNDGNRSALNYSTQRCEGSLQDAKLSASDITVPTVQITQHKDIIRSFDEQQSTVESDANCECLKNDTCIAEAAGQLEPVECYETKCKVPENICNSNFVVNLSGKCDSEGVQRETEKERVRLSEPSIEQPARYRNFWMQDTTSCRSPSSDTNHGDSDTDITDTEIRGRSPQVRSVYVVVVSQLCRMLCKSRENLPRIIILSLCIYLCVCMRACISIWEGHKINLLKVKL